MCVWFFFVCAKLLGQTVQPEQETGAFRYQCEMHFVYQQSSLVVKSVKRQGHVCGRCSAVIQRYFEEVETRCVCQCDF